MDEFVLVDVTPLLSWPKPNTVRARVVEPNNGLNEGSGVRKDEAPNNGSGEPNNGIGQSLGVGKNGEASNGIGEALGVESEQAGDGVNIDVEDDG